MTLTRWFACLVGGLVLVATGCAPQQQAPPEPVGTAQSALVSVTWFDVVGTTASGNDLTKTSASGWNAGAASNEILGGDGYVQLTTAETGTDKMVGLSHADPAQNPSAIDFGLYLSSGAGVNVYEDGGFRASIGGYAAGDVFQIQVSGTTVTYLQNGSLLYTSTKAPILPLLVGASLYSTGATVDNVVLSSGYWTDVVGVTTSGESMTKTGASGWNAGAATTATLAGDGYAQFTTAETSTDKMVGLSHADPAQNYAAIDFALYLSSGPVVNVYEGGVWRASIGGYAAGDVFRIQVSGTTVTYLQNGNLLYTSTTAPTLPLLLGTSLYSTGATVDNVVLQSTWQDAVGVSLSGESMTKTGPSGWNAGAATTAILAGSGYAQFTTAETNTDKLVGLSHADPAQDPGAIDFGLYLSSGAGVNVYEDGVWRGSFGAYAAGDVFQIQVIGTQVSYLQNGSLLYTSTTAPTLSLLAAATLYTPGATANDVSLVPWAVTGGNGHTCAMTAGGGVKCWGNDESGQLGNGSTTSSLVPVAVSGLSSGVAAITGGEIHTCALTMSGGALCWGSNDYSQLGNNSGTDSPVPVAPRGLSSGVASVAAGGYHTCALTTGGAVLCWGWNEAGQLGNNSSTNTAVPVAVSGLSSGVAAIAGGFEHTCALTTAGGVLCWGWNQYGQLGNNSTTNSLVPVAVSGLSSGVAAIAARGSNTCALTTGGAVLCWGWNAYGQLGDNSGIDSHVPVAVSGLSSGVAAIALGAAHPCALTTGGGVLCWGDDSNGQLGNNSTTNSLVPVAVSGLSSGIAAIAGGYDQTCAVTTAGSVLCWGNNTFGQLGDNSTTQSLVPAAVVGF